MKIGVHKDFVKFTGKHLCQNLLFNKVEGPATSSKRDSNKGNKTPISENILQGLLLFCTFNILTGRHLCF